MLKGSLLFTELPEMDFKVKALGRDVQIKKGILFYIIQRAKLKRYKGLSVALLIFLGRESTNHKLVKCIKNIIKAGALSLESIIRTEFKNLIINKLQKPFKEIICCRHLEGICGLIKNFKAIQI